MQQIGVAYARVSIACVTLTSPPSQHEYCVHKDECDVQHFMPSQASVPSQHAYNAHKDVCERQHCIPSQILMQCAQCDL